MFNKELSKLSITLGICWRWMWSKKLSLCPRGIMWSEGNPPPTTKISWKYPKRKDICNICSDIFHIYFIFIWNTHCCPKHCWNRRSKIFRTQWGNPEDNPSPSTKISEISWKKKNTFLQCKIFYFKRQRHAHNIFEIVSVTNLYILNENLNSAGITCSGSTPRLQNVKQHIFQIDQKNPQNLATFLDQYVLHVLPTPENTARPYLSQALNTHLKYCQRHNGPEGWVHITRTQFTVHKSWTYYNFRISIKH